MKKVNFKKSIAVTAMCMVCALPCSATIMNADASTVVNTASVTGVLEDVMNTAITVAKKVGAIETNSNSITESTNRADDAVPRYINVGQRSAQNYNMIIDQFKVQTNRRYKPVGGSTWCNIFAWDVMKAMHVPFSHWVAPNGRPLTHNEAKKTKGAYECNVRSHQSWLKNYGSRYGWRKVTALEAQKMANKGKPTLVLNTSGTHIAVVRPETSKYKYSTNNPVISQAGKYNVNYGKAGTYFGTTKNLEYWVHD